MVQVIMKRSHSGGPVEQMNSVERPLAHAIRTIIEFELGFGGRIVQINEENFSLTTMTIVFNCRDYTTINCKTKEEFITLLQACHTHQQIFGIKNEQDLDKAAEKVIGFTKGKALLVTMASGPLLGGVLTGKKTLNRIIASFAMVAAGMEEQDVVELLTKSSDEEVQQWIEAACAA